MSDADGAGMVSVFLRHGSDVLLCRRSEAVGSGSGRWGVVAGHAGGDPERLAREAVREGTGLDPGDCSPVRRGASFPVEDPDHGAWRVHPVLFDCPTREVTTNRGTAAQEWVQPTAILDRETVPWLWESYRRVAPTVAAVREDREHGSEYVSRRAVEVLRDAAAALAAGVDAPVAVPDGEGEDEWSRLTALADGLLGARASMAVVANRVNRVTFEARGDREASAVRHAAERLLAGLDDARIEAPDALRGATVATLSHSGTVRDLLARCDPTEVVIAESRPGGEGRAAGAALADTLAVDVTLCGDAGIAHASTPATPTRCWSARTPCSRTGAWSTRSGLGRWRAPPPHRTCPSTSRPTLTRSRRRGTGSTSSRATRTSCSGPTRRPRWGSNSRRST